MAKFLHIQQFGKPLHYGPELQTMLIKLGFTLLSNGQTYQQFSQKANFKNFPSDAWLTDMFPVKTLVNIDALKDLDKAIDLAPENPYYLLQRAEL